MQILDTIVRHYTTGVYKPMESLYILSRIKDANSLSRRSIPKLLKIINVSIFGYIKVRLNRDITNDVHNVSLILHNIWGVKNPRVDYYKISFINGRAVLVDWVYREGDWRYVYIHPHIDRMLDFIQFVKDKSEDVTYSKIIKRLKNFNTRDNDEILVKKTGSFSYFWDENYEFRQTRMNIGRRWSHTGITVSFGEKGVYVQVNINISSIVFPSENSNPRIYQHIGNKKVIEISMPKIVSKARDIYTQF